MKLPAADHRLIVMLAKIDDISHAELVRRAVALYHMDRRTDPGWHAVARRAWMDDVPEGAVPPDQA